MVEWPTIKDVATRLGVSRQYILHLVSSGRIHARMKGDVWLLDPESVRKWEESRGKTKMGRKPKQKQSE